MPGEWFLVRWRCCKVYRNPLPNSVDEAILDPRDTNTPMKPKAVALLLLSMLGQSLAAADLGVVSRKTPLRETPSIGAESLGDLTVGTKLNVIRRNGLWFEVEVIDAAKAGWVRFSRVRVTDSPTTEQQGSSSGNVLVSISRSATGLFGYGNRHAQSQGTIATVGIRGLNASDLQAARPDKKQLKQLETYRSTPEAATLFARVGTLNAQLVDYLEDDGGFGLSLPSSSSSSSSSSSFTKKRD